MMLGSACFFVCYNVTTSNLSLIPLQQLVLAVSRLAFNMSRNIHFASMLLKDNNV